ncbi:hypothetical protein FACS189468_5500 [Spirochaetia bacterium]|nr:hypothetical protein FACS189468_5500 [Spirochaetia bacterium]
MKKIMATILFVILFLVSSCSKNEQYDTIEEDSLFTNKSDFYEGQGIDTNNNGVPDFVVRNGRFIGTVSGKDFGPATLENFNARKTTPSAFVKPIPVPNASSTSNYNANKNYINTNNKNEVENYLHGLGF